MKRIAVLFLFFLTAFSLEAQSNSGELRLKVADPSGLGLRATIQITSAANQYRNALATNDQGSLDVQRLPYGVYDIEIKQPGFADVSQRVEIRSSIPTDYAIQLKLPSVNQAVAISAVNTLIDPDQAGSVSEIGSNLIQNRVSSVPGRSCRIW
jgi:hypothetical protein